MFVFLSEYRISVLYICTIMSSYCGMQLESLSSSTSDGECLMLT